MISSPASPPAGGHAAPHRRRFLYVEDLQPLRELLEIVLTGDGHALACAANGLEALEQVIADPSGFDFVITDHLMPVMDGLELVTALRTTRFSGRIVVLSAALTPEIEAAYRDLRVDCILVKPISPLVLRTLLDTL